ncbi:MAG: hypothetical protein CMF59_05260 [Leptospiraceae bacterium]|nr:hypothetical protein [Leptospiraceae bacterium]
MNKSWLKIIGSLVALLLIGVITLWLGLRTPSLSVPEQGPTRLLGVTLIIPGKGRSLVDIGIKDGRIAWIRPANQHEPETEQEALTIRGGYVLPGLIDMHVHYPPSVAIGQQDLWSLLFVAHGVTTVRETGSIDGTSMELRHEIRDGKRHGPNLFSCGKIIDGPNKAFPSNVSVSGEMEARALVQLRKTEGADCVKLYHMLGRDEAIAILDESKKQGLKAIGHLPHSLELEDAPGELMHFMGFPVVDKAVVGRSENKLADWARLSDQEIEETARKMKELEIVQVPDLINIEMRTGILDPGVLEGDTGLAHLPEFWGKAWRTLFSAPYDEASRIQYQGMQEKWSSILKALKRNNVRFYAGSDTLMPFVAPGSSIHRNLELYVQAGLTVDEALASATVVPGEWYNPRRGTVEIGLPADLIVLSADPYSSGLQVLRTPSYVIVSGRVYTRQYLDSALASFDEHFLEGTYPWILNMIADGIISLYQR